MGVLAHVSHTRADYQLIFENNKLKEINFESDTNKSLT